MSILKFFKNLFGVSEKQTSDSPVYTETKTKVEEPVTKVVEEVKVVKSEEVKVEEVKKTEEPKKTAKEIKAKIRKPSNNTTTPKPTNSTPKSKPAAQDGTSKPRPKRRRPQQKKNEQ